MIEMVQNTFKTTALRFPSLESEGTFLYKSKLVDCENIPAT